MKETKEFKIIFTDSGVKDYLYFGCHGCNKTFQSFDAWINHYVQEHLCNVE